MKGYMVTTPLMEYNEEILYIPNQGIIHYKVNPQGKILFTNFQDHPEVLEGIQRIIDEKHYTHIKELELPNKEALSMISLGNKFSKTKKELATEVTSLLEAVVNQKV